jgi:adenosylhomocysteinase
MIELRATAKLLRSQTETVSNLRGVDVLLVQHLFEDTLAFVTALKAANILVRAVVGIPYSAKEHVRHELENRGIDTLVPDMERISEVVLTHVQQSTELGRKSILHEVGGYCSELASNSAKFEEGCLGIVEETKQGLWRYSKQPTLRVPVVQFADAKLKTFESEFVGRAVARSVDEDLALLGKSVDTADLGVIGFGDIGSGVARSLRRRGSHVRCFDIKPMRMMDAGAQGFRCVDLQRLIRASDAIVGATGVGCMEAEHLENLRDGVLLSSASSRNLEFPISAIRQARVEDSKLSAHVHEYRLKWGKSVRVSSDGFPVNFRSFSLPPSFGDLMFCQVLMGFGRILDRSYPVGLHRLRESDQEIVADAWWESHRDQNPRDGSWELRI